MVPEPDSLIFPLRIGESLCAALFSGCHVFQIVDEGICEIYGFEGFIFPRAYRMDVFRHQPFSGTGFPLKKHGQIRIRGVVGLFFLCSSRLLDYYLL